MGESKAAFGREIKGPAFIDSRSRAIVVLLKLIEQQLNLRLEVLGRIDRVRQEVLRNPQDKVVVKDLEILECEDELDPLDRAVLVDVERSDELGGRHTLVLQLLGQREPRLVVALDVTECLFLECAE